MGLLDADVPGLFAAVAEASSDPIVVVGLDGTILAWSRGAERLYGYASEEVVGRSAAVLLPEGHRSELTSIVEQIRTGERVAGNDFVGRTKRGLLIQLMLSASPALSAAGEVKAVVLVAHDVTQSRQDDGVRRTMELRWQSIIESAVDGIIVIDEQGRIEAFNPAAERLFGYTETEVVGQNVSILMPAPYRDEHDGYLRRYLQNGDARIIGVGREVQAQKRDGTVFPVHLSVGEMVVEEQRKFTGILHDLSARVRLEERLRNSESRWRAIVESAVDAIIVIDSNGLIEGFNPAAERLFGYSAAEAVGQSVSMLMPSPHREEHNSYLQRYQRERSPRIIGIGREVAGRHRDGTILPLHLSVGEMSIGGQQKFIGILHDLSARKRIEEQLREQESLARIGQMAAVLAHEIRNPLAGIRGAMQVLAARCEPGSKEGAVAKEVIARVDTLNDLMQDLLLFARPPKPRPAPVDLTPLVQTTLELLSGDPAISAMNVHIEGSAPRALADAELLKIVFQNLLINGAHAMGGRGELRVRLGGADRVSSVAFADRGPGIPAEIREKIFAPFFTTKARGTGLGLSTAKRLIEAQSGSILVQCPTEGGTTVTVQLPAL
jgi:two-component system sensor kinase FixL